MMFHDRIQTFLFYRRVVDPDPVTQPDSTYYEENYKYIKIILMKKFTFLKFQTVPYVANHAC
jgi:hypothetical protein